MVRMLYQHRWQIVAAAKHMALLMESVIGQGIIWAWLKRSCLMNLSYLCLLVMLVFATIGGACASHARAESRPERTPISLKDLQEKFAVSERDKQPVRIEDRIIEDRGQDNALTFLNEHLHKGHGITLINCEIKGDINFAQEKHERSICDLPMEYKELLGEKALEDLSKWGIEAVAFVEQPIRIEKCTIRGCIIAAIEEPSDAKMAMVFLKSTAFSNTEIEKDARFYFAAFGGEADFGGVKFGGEADFARATFGAEADFARATFGAEAGFGRATFRGKTSFIGATFSGKTSFIGATFRGEPLFIEASFGGNAFFGSTTFRQTPVFSLATFGGGAFFEEAKFGGKAFFSLITFGGGAYFWGTTFGDGLMARQAVFEKTVSFSGALFRGEVDFSGCDFQGHTSLHGARFASGDIRVKTHAVFRLCTFHKDTDFTYAQFQEPAIFSSCVIQQELSFDNVRFESDLDLSGVKVARTGRISLVGARCEDILFGVSQPGTDWYVKNFLAIRRARDFQGNPIPEELDPGCSVDLTGAFYSRLLFIDWDKLAPAIERSLKMAIPQRTEQPDKPKAPENAMKENGEKSATLTTKVESSLDQNKNAQMAALRLLARNYQAVGSKPDAEKSYAFYREKLLEYRWSWIDWIIKWTTGFGAHKDRLGWWFLGLWLIPWVLGYWRPGVIVAAKEDAEPPNDTLWNWVGAQTTDQFLRQLRMIGFSLWFSLNLFLPGVELFGYKRWEPCNDKIAEVVPMRYTTLASLQRISGWLLIPIGIAAFAGLFDVK